MKYFTLIFAVSIFFIGCNQKNTINNIKERINIDAIKSYLPANYLAEPNLIYKKSTGEELLLKIRYKEGVEERTYQDKEYETQKIEIVLYDPENPIFRILMLGNTNYSTAGSIVQNLDIVLMPLNQNGSTWATLRFKDLSPQILPEDDFRPQLTLNGREFEDVYIFTGKIGNHISESYSELDFNSEVGVVAFKDENNELWVFNRFE